MWQNGLSANCQSSSHSMWYAFHGQGRWLLLVLAYHFSYSKGFHRCSSCKISCTSVHGTMWKYNNRKYDNRHPPLFKMLCFQGLLKSIVLWQNPDGIYSVSSLYILFAIGFWNISRTHQTSKWWDLWILIGQHWMRKVAKCHIL